MNKRDKMNNAKWFYEAQTAASKKLSEKYGEYNCNFQDITPNRVHEQFTVWVDSQPYLVHLTIYKSVGSAHYTLFTTEPTLREIEAAGKLK